MATLEAEQVTVDDEDLRRAVAQFLRSRRGTPVEPETIRFETNGHGGTVAVARVKVAGPKKG